jgi:hypothetical protein
MSTVRRIKLLALAAIASSLLLVPATSSAAEPSPAFTAGGISVNACMGKDLAPLLIFVHGVDCDRALSLANSATSDDDRCPDGWNTEHQRLKALDGERRITGPLVSLCTRGSGRNQRAFTYRVLPG